MASAASRLGVYPSRLALCSAADEGGDWIHAGCRSSHSISAARMMLVRSMPVVSVARSKAEIIAELRTKRIATGAGTVSAMWIIYTTYTSGVKRVALDTDGHLFYTARRITPSSRPSRDHPRPRRHRTWL